MLQPTTIFKSGKSQMVEKLRIMAFEKDADLSRKPSLGPVSRISRDGEICSEEILESRRKFLLILKE